MKVLSALLITCAIGLSIIAFRVHDYIQNDPTFCTSCHTMDAAFERWQKSAHSKVTCHECHTPSLAANLHQLFYYVTMRPDEVKKHAFVPREICEKCHHQDNPDGKWKQIAQTRGHEWHVYKMKVECVKCHSTSLHKFEPPQEVCKSCHKEKSLAKSQMVDMHCLECHNFLAKDNNTLRPDRETCLGCHKDMHVKNEVFPMGAPMAWACGKCHKPHSQPIPSRELCLDCHKDAMDGEIHQTRSHRECVDCHRPHTWKIAERETCLRCHQGKSDHEANAACNKCHGL